MGFLGLLTQPGTPAMNSAVGQSFDAAASETAGLLKQRELSAVKDKIDQRDEAAQKVKDDAKTQQQMRDRTYNVIKNLSAGATEYNKTLATEPDKYEHAPEANATLGLIAKADAALDESYMTGKPLDMPDPNTFSTRLPATYTKGYQDMQTLNTNLKALQVRKDEEALSADKTKKAPPSPLKDPNVTGLMDATKELSFAQQDASAAALKYNSIPKLGYAPDATAALEAKSALDAKNTAESKISGLSRNVGQYHSAVVSQAYGGLLDTPGQASPKTALDDLMGGHYVAVDTNPTPNPITDSNGQSTTLVTMGPTNYADSRFREPMLGAIRKRMTDHDVYSNASLLRGYSNLYTLLGGQTGE